MTQRDKHSTEDEDYQAHLAERERRREQSRNALLGHAEIDELLSSVWFEAFTLVCATTPSWGQSSLRALAIGNRISSACASFGRRWC